MSLSSSFLSEDQFTCSICLDVFTNPVSTPCGHSFCLGCISSYWDGNGNKTCQCPLCKESFRKRPELHINRTLKEITEQFQRMAEAGLNVEGGLGGGGGGVEEGRGRVGNGVPGSDWRPTVPPRPGEMPVSLIAEMKNRFQRPAASRTPPPISHPHPPPPQHTLPPPSCSPSAAPPSQRRFTLSGPADSTPDAPLCPAHLRGLDLFCRTDQTCVCASCMETEHQGHTVLPAKREWQIKKSQLGITEVELKDLISERERKVEEVKTCLQDIEVCASRETEGTMHVFTSLVASVERCQAELLELVEMARRAAHHQGQTLLRELEQEISELKKRSSALAHLGQSDDCVLFLRTFPTITSPLQTRDWSDAIVTSELSSGLVLRTVNQMMDRFQEQLRRLPEICSSVAPAGLQPPTDQAVSRPSPSSSVTPAGLQPSTDQAVSRPNPKVRMVQEYAVDVTLDLATAHPRLLISEDRKQVRCSEQYQPVQDGPQRFNRVVCVLGQPGFSSGRHYWEVEVGGKTDWDVGVASSSINRKGKITVSPAHGYWFLSLRDRTDYAFRTEPSTALGLSTRPSRLGVYVDYEKGQVSFYDVDNKLLIFTYTDRFSDTIQPFFSPCTNKSGCNDAPLVICPVSLPDDSDDIISRAPVCLNPRPRLHSHHRHGNREEGLHLKGGGVRFPDDDEPPGSPTRRDDLSNDASIIAIPEKDGSFLVKAGFLKTQHRYEIVFTLLEVPSLGKDVCSLLPSSSSSPTARADLRVTCLSPTPEGGVRVTCEYTTHQEGVLQEELTLGSRGRRDRGLRVRLQARVMDRHHGTPMLLEGVRCLGTQKDNDSKHSDRKRI